MQRKTGFLDRDGERIYWECVGEGPPLVLCHGAGGNHAVWYQQVPCFGRTHRVVTWDQRGFGRSTARGGPTHPTCAAGDLLALLDHLELDRANLVGQSMGGWAVLRATLDRPDRVARLVLADTPGGIPNEATRALLRRAEAGGDALAPPPLLGRHPALDPSLAERDPARAYLYQMLGNFGEPDLAALVPGLLAAEVAPDALERLALPTLCIVGENDSIFPPGIIESCAAQLPQAEVVEIPGAGHSPYFEAPEAWNQALATFLSKPSK